MLSSGGYVWKARDVPHAFRQKQCSVEVRTKTHVINTGNRDGVVDVLEELGVLA